MRTFIAIELDKSIQGRLADLQARLKPRCGKVKWVDPAGIHLTLKFLGEIDDRLAPDVGRTLDALAKQCRPFDINVENVGTFPPSGSVKVIWVGIQDPTGKLGACHALCERQLEPLGFARERRPFPFSPHLTLARNRNPANSKAIRAALGQNPSFNAGAQTVSGVTFYQSTLTPQGPIYNTLSRHVFL